MNIDTQTAIAIERARASHLGDGSDEGEDDRRVWSRLDQNMKDELAGIYLDETPAIRVKELFVQCICNGDTREQMVELIGKRFCKENDEEWSYE